MKEHSQSQKKKNKNRKTFLWSLPGRSLGGIYFFSPLAKGTEDSYLRNVSSSLVPVMKEIKNLWVSVKAFYFRYENVILRVPFCFLLHLGTIFDKIVKESNKEDTKTWYEIAGTRPSTWLLKISSHVEKNKTITSCVPLVKTPAYFSARLIPSVLAKVPWRDVILIFLDFTATAIYF